MIVEFKRYYDTTYLTYEGKDSELEVETIEAALGLARKELLEEHELTHIIIISSDPKEKITIAR